MRTKHVVLAAAHLDHDPTNNQLRNLRGLCQRCHLIHDRPHHLEQRRITYLLRRALGDLFLGQYDRFRVSGQAFQLVGERGVGRIRPPAASADLPPPRRYDTQEHLIAELNERVIRPGNGRDSMRP
jgi:hypothetical protein